MPIVEPHTQLETMPELVPVFPLSGTILLPGRELPLNIFEPRYLAMVNASLAGDRVIGMIQPQENSERAQTPPLQAIGGLGRITAFSERPDGRNFICLTGICRFRIVEELKVHTLFRQCQVDYADYANDLSGEKDKSLIDRTRLLDVSAALIGASLEDDDWREISQSDDDVLVNTLAMIGPFGAREKQTLLEAADLKTRNEYLIAFAEMNMAQTGDNTSASDRTH